jgi:hypothetical protein
MSQPWTRSTLQVRRPSFFEVLPSWSLKNRLYVPAGNSNSNSPPTSNHHICWRYAIVLNLHVVKNIEIYISACIDATSMIHIQYSTSSGKSPQQHHTCLINHEQIKMIVKLFMVKYLLYWKLLVEDMFHTHKASAKKKEGQKIFNSSEPTRQAIQ